MPHVFINARFLTQPVTGVQRYARELVRAVDRHIGQLGTDAAFSFTLLAPKGADALALKHIPLEQVGTLKGHAWEQLELPRFTREDFLLNLCNTAPVGKSRQMVTIHDAAVYGFPQAYSRTFRSLYKTLLPALSRTATHILTDSEFSKRELVRYLRVPADKFTVVYLGKEHVWAEAADNKVFAKHGVGYKPFLLAVSSLNPNKNFAGIVRALERLKDPAFDVVIAGGTNPAVFSGRADSLPESVKHLGYVSEGELRALYERATGFVYPSFYEGFGLPPLEAMACGSPVIVSHAASLPEVCGDAALYCDPHSHQDIADKIERLMSDSELREGLRHKGLERAKRFSWDACARETLAVLEQVLAS